MKDYNRSSSGTFGLGNDGGPGRPRREMEQMYLEAAIRALPLERWIKIVEVAAAQAEAGDKDARKWISENFTVGKPTDRLELSQEDNTVVTLLWGANRSDPSQVSDGENDTPALPAPSGGDPEAS